MATNLLTHSRKKWRERGYYVEGTEQINRLPGGIVRRKDLFGFADLVAIPLARSRPGDDTFVFIQVTSKPNVSTRLRKIQDGEETHGRGQWARPISELAEAVLDADHRIIVEGWHQPKGPGTKWECREEEVEIDALSTAGSP